MSKKYFKGIDQYTSNSSQDTHIIDGITNNTPLTTTLQEEYIDKEEILVWCTKSKKHFACTKFTLKDKIHLDYTYCPHCGKPLVGNIQERKQW